MGPFIEEIYYAQSNFICKQGGLARSNFQFKLKCPDLNVRYLLGDIYCLV